MVQTINFTSGGTSIWASPFVSCASCAALRPRPSNRREQHLEEFAFCASPMLAPSYQVFEPRFSPCRKQIARNSFCFYRFFEV